MKSLLKLTLMMFAVAAIFPSCKEDPAAPSVLLDNTALSAKAGEEISIVATVTAPGGLSSLSIQKFWDDTEVGDPTEVSSLTGGEYTFMYTVTQDDVEPILKFRFTATDGNGKTSTPVEAVVDVELTKAQLLVKYDWLHYSSVRKATGSEDISDADGDDVYRFSEDGTYQVSYGSAYSGFEGLDQFCYWQVNEETGRLIMTKSSFNGATWLFDVDKRDTLDITSLTDMQMEADVILRGLDFFNDGTQDVPYKAEEDYSFKYSAQAKGSSFDPYKEGPDDDAGPSNGECIDF